MNGYIELFAGQNNTLDRVTLAHVDSNNIALIHAAGTNNLRVDASLASSIRVARDGAALGHLSLCRWAADVERKTIAGEVVAFVGLCDFDGAERAGFAVRVGVVFELDGLEGCCDGGNEELRLLVV